MGNILGPGLMNTLMNVFRKIGIKGIPVWNQHLPASSPKISSYLSGMGERYIYFPSCLHRTMGTSNSSDSIINMLMELAPRFGVEFIIPKSINSLCCGMPFASKGFDTAHNVITEKTIAEIYSLSEQGQIPILLDMSSCSYHILGLNNDTIEKLKFVDIVQFFQIPVDWFDYAVHFVPAYLKRLPIL